MIALRTAIVYASYHNRNTEKVAQVLTDVLSAESYAVLEGNVPASIAEYDVIGIGSGIYRWQWHDAIRRFLESLPEGNGKPVFLFSTSGFRNRNFNKKTEELLLAKGYEVIDQFHCKGNISIGPKFLHANIANDRPNRADLEEAARFAERIREAMNNHIQP